MGLSRRRARWRSAKSAGLQAALLTVILAIVFAEPGRAAETRRSAVSQQDVQAKLGYCKDCHGPSAQGYRGYFPIPRLAGQQPRVFGKSAARLYRASPHQQYHVQRGACLEPGNDGGTCRELQETQSPAHRRRPKRPRSHGKENLRKWRARRQCCGVRRLSRSGRYGQRRNSPPCRSALSLRHQGIDELGKGTRAKSGTSRIRQPS